MNHLTSFGSPGRRIGLVLVATALVGGGAGYMAGAVGYAATAQSHAGGARAASAAAAPTTLSPFKATGLPAGAATGVPQLLVFPAGFTLKHTHGGPTYVYVVSGELIISDNAGVKTYPAGSFFWESPGHVHTVHTTRPSQAFVLTFLPPGADATIPVK
jgi:quercetin dioxygenase-like cupin family protein